MAGAKRNTTAPPADWSRPVSRWAGWPERPLRRSRGDVGRYADELLAGELRCHAATMVRPTNTSPGLLLGATGTWETVRRALGGLRETLRQGGIYLPKATRCETIPFRLRQWFSRVPQRLQ